VSDVEDAAAATFAAASSSVKNSTGIRRKVRCRACTEDKAGRGTGRRVPAAHRPYTPREPEAGLRTREMHPRSRDPKYSCHPTPARCMLIDMTHTPFIAARESWHQPRYANAAMCALSLGGEASG
jgi:hypothetical protein